jgi:hypothetical protein
LGEKAAAKTTEAAGRQRSAERLGGELAQHGKARGREQGWRLRLLTTLRCSGGT